MKIGLSSYSLFRAMKSGEMSIINVIDWIAKNDGEHIELVPNLGFDFEKEPELIDEVFKKAKSVGIEISNYAISANFLTKDDSTFKKEVERVKKEVDIAHALGVKYMRHDVASRPREECTIQNFEKDLPKLVEACQEIADYALQYDITTSVENHGFYIQGSDRIQSLIHNVNRSNFKTTLDVGNFICVDESSVVAVKKNISDASVIHLKDMYSRSAHLKPGHGWRQSLGGNYYRPAIVGYGDINMREVIRVIKNTGYSGYITIEFEGLEECKLGSKMGMDNARYFWGEV